MLHASKELTHLLYISIDAACEIINTLLFIMSRLFNVFQASSSCSEQACP